MLSGLYIYDLLILPYSLEKLIIPSSYKGKIKEGISTETAKKLAKFLRDSGPKSLKTQIQGDELRVSSKSRDDLQEAIALVKAESWDFAPQFTNYR